MARWRLQVSHYLYTNPPTEWEHKETSRETGRQTRAVYKVPRLLDIKDPTDWTEGDNIVVCNGNNPQPRDVIFVGDPTPDMEPIDDEAKVISQKFIDSGRWNKPIEGEVHGEALIRQFMAEIAKIQAGPAQPISASGIDAKAFAELQEQVKSLIEQNTKLRGQITPLRRS